MNAKLVRLLFFVKLYTISYSFGYPQDSLYIEKGSVRKSSSKADSTNEKKVKSIIKNGMLEKDKKVEVELEFTPKEEKTTLEYFFNYLKDFLPSVIAAVGLGLTIPILRKKLTENHITTALNNIHNANAEVQKYNQTLIDKYLLLTYKDNKLTKEDFENITKDVSEGFTLSQNASSDVTTLMYFLKITFQETSRQYDLTKPIILSNRIYNLINDTLNLANFYSTQVVQIPISIKTEKKNLINDKIKKFVTHSDYLKYKHFNQGVIRDPRSAHFTLFYGMILNTGVPLIMRSAYQIFSHPNVIMHLLYAHSLYAAPILEKPSPLPFFGTNKTLLHLIGFTKQTSFNGERSDEYVKLVYSNINNIFHFIGSMPSEEIKEYSDSYINTSGFKLDVCTNFKKEAIETITIKFEKELLENLFTQNKKIIKKKLGSI